MFFVIPSGGGETSSPPPKSRGFIIDSREYSAGRGIARKPSSSQPQCVHLRSLRVLWRRRDCTSGRPPHNNSGYLGGGRTGRPSHSSGVFFVFPAVDGALTFGGVNTAHHTGVFVYTNFKNTSYLPVLAIYLGNQVDREFPDRWCLYSVHTTREISFDTTAHSSESTSNMPWVLVSPSGTLRVKSTAISVSCRPSWWCR